MEAYGCELASAGLVAAEQVPDVLSGTGVQGCDGVDYLFVSNAAKHDEEECNGSEHEKCKQGADPRDVSALDGLAGVHSVRL
jgi:hypothetical protein